MTTPASKHDEGRELLSGSDAKEIYERGLQVGDLVRANSEAVVQAWTTAMCGMLNYQEQLTCFVGMRVQKDVEMAGSVTGCRDFEQFIDLQTAFGRTMIEDYMNASADMLQSALDIFRDSGGLVEERAEEAPRDLRQAAAS